MNTPEVSPDFKKRLEELDLSKLDCFYADVRLEEVFGTELGYKNAVLEEFKPSESNGAFLRVYNNGKWFYKALTDLSQIENGFAELIEQSRSISGTCNEIFSHVPKTHEEKLSFSDRDPRAIPLTKKRELCESYFDVVKNISEVKEFKIFYKDRYQKRAFKSNRGRSFIYDYADYGLVLIANMRDGEFFFRDKFRKWTAKIEDLQSLHKEAKEYFIESLRHLRAPSIKAGKYPVVMDSEVVGVFTHESFGHKSEADFMLGDEKAISEWKIGQRVANECVSIVDHGGEIDNSGYCPFDDEGVATQKTYLIKDGLLQGRLHSLETAHAFNELPTGNARAMNFEFEPIVRMTNTYIEPGRESAEQVLSSVKEGLMISDYSHGSGLSTFTIAPSRSYWIRDGKIAEPVKVAVVSGTVFETLNQISRVSNSLTIHSSAFGGCGKDEQAPLRVGDGGPMILIDQMQVG